MQKQHIRRASVRVDPQQHVTAVWSTEDPLMIVTILVL